MNYMIEAIIIVVIIAVIFVVVRSRKDSEPGWMNKVVDMFRKKQ
jgi:hypothetical protein